MLKEVVNLGGISMKTKTFNSKICIQLIMNTQKPRNSQYLYKTETREKQDFSNSIFFHREGQQDTHH